MSDLAQLQVIEKAKRYAAAARSAQERGEHRRAALLYNVASTLLEPMLPATGPHLPCPFDDVASGKSDT